MEEQDKDIIYDNAQKLFRQKDYSSALVEFKKIRDWKDSSALIQECSRHILNTRKDNNKEIKVITSSELHLKQFDRGPKPIKQEVPKKKGVIAKLFGKKPPKEKVEKQPEKKKEVVKTEQGSMQILKNKSGKPYEFPPLDCLEDYSSICEENSEKFAENGKLIEKTFAEYNVNLSYSGYQQGPVLTTFEFELGTGTQINKIQARKNEISYALGGKKVRLLTPIPGKKAVGVEVPNDNAQLVGFKRVFESCKKQGIIDSFNVPMVLGETVAGQPYAIDVSKMPHLIIAGTTGSGKSVCLNAFINTILCGKTPNQVRMIMVDPKVVELSVYDGIPHLLTPVITEAPKVVQAMNWLVGEMEKRYQLLAKYKVRNINDFNDLVLEDSIKEKSLPFIVMLIDEFADLMSVIGKEIDTSIGRIAAKARAVGIHLILATQRPSADVITGTLKSNLPGRIAFAVTSETNSRIILDESGAEDLMGKGDMLLLDPSQLHLQRMQGAFISGKEVNKVVRCIQQSN